MEDENLADDMPHFSIFYSPSSIIVLIFL